MSQTGVGCGPTTSTPQRVTVVADPTATLSGNGAVCVGGSDVITLASSGGTGTKSYAWQSSTNGSTFTTVSGQTGTSLNTGTLTADRWYRAIVSQTGAGCGPTTSAAAKVTVVTDPVTTIAAGGTICSGGTKTLTTTTTGGSGSVTGYLWQTNASGAWATISGACLLYTSPSPRD